MKKTLYIFTFIFLFLIVSRIKSQDIHFSQFNENPSLINPALTGESGILRVSSVYRDQWRGAYKPYKSFGMSIESRLRTSNWDEVERQSMTFKKNKLNRFAAGLSVYSDKAGTGNLNITQINLSFATFVSVSKKSQLSLGLQGRLFQYKIDNSKLLFSNQFNGYEYDHNLLSGESFNTLSFVSTNFSSGLNWHYDNNEKSIITNRQVKVNIGTALYNIKKTNQSYLLNDPVKQYTKYVFYGNFLFGLHQTNIGIVPSYLIQLQGSNIELIAGSIIKYYIKENSVYTGIIKRSSVNFGLFYRNKDAVIFSFSYDKNEQFSVGFSYDVNLSGLSPATKLNGGPEITLRFNSSNPYLYQKRPKAN